MLLTYYLFLLHRIVIGYDEGTIMVKIGREEPVASMDKLLVWLLFLGYRWRKIAFGCQGVGNL